MRILRILPFLLFPLALAAACGGDSDSLPDFAHEEDGTLTIDVREATGSLARYEESPGNSIRYDFDGCEAAFLATAHPFTSVQSPASTDTPPTELSNVLDNDDGVAQHMFVPIMDAESDSIELHLFFDSEWAEVIDGETAIFISRTPPEQGFLDQPERMPLEFSGDSFIHYETVLNNAARIDPCLTAMNVFITNKPGDFQAVARTFNTLQLEEIEPGEFIVRIQALN